MVCCRLAQAVRYFAEENNLISDTMDEKTFRNVAVGYMVTNAIARNAAYELAEINRKEALERANITSLS